LFRKPSAKGFNSNHFHSQAGRAFVADRRRDLGQIRHDNASTAMGRRSMQIRLSENFRAVFYAPFYATLELGFAKQEGLDVSFIDSSAPEGGAPGLLDGSVDVTWGGPMRVMRARDEAKGAPLVCFCEVVCKDPFYLVGPRRAANFTLADLSRLKFASVSEVPTPWLCLQHDLREIGVDPGRIDRVATRTMPENLQALRTASLDVAQMFEPYASSATRQGIGEILHAASARGMTSYTTFLATREGVTKNGTAFAALTRAARRAQRWIGDHGAEELAKVLAAYFPQAAREDLVSAFARYIEVGLWSNTGPVSRQGFQRLAESLRSGGFISRMPDYDDCVADLSLN
jgi:NitT/TauT family transport system substrate-binding protein